MLVENVPDSRQRLDEFIASVLFAHRLDIKRVLQGGGFGRVSGLLHISKA